MNKQEFIINTLKPYFLDTSLCGTDGDKCRYRINGKPCAVGRYIPDEVYGEWMEDRELSDVLQFISQEAKDANLNLQEWEMVRSIHDDLGLGFPELAINGLTALEAHSEIDLTELKELASLTNT